VTLPHLAVDLGPGIRAVFTRARTDDGRPFNLSGAVGDTEHTAADRARLDGWLGVPVTLARQVHGAHVRVCGALDAGPEGAPVDADALVTVGRGVAVGVLVADCVPVLLADHAAGVVGAVHAGRRGLVAGVVPAAVRAMVDRGASRLSAVLGPSICGGCYEVPAALQGEVADVVPGTASTTAAGTPGLDLRAGVRWQLARAGVARVAVVEACTLEDDAWFSHRGTGPGRAEGRFAGVVALVPEG
jgi:hypothetical protein